MGDAFGGYRHIAPELTTRKRRAGICRCLKTGRESEPTTYFVARMVGYATLTHPAKLTPPLAASPVRPALPALLAATSAVRRTACRARCKSRWRPRPSQGPAALRRRP